MNSRLNILVLLYVVISATCISGCAPWSNDKDTMRSKLVVPKTRIAPDAVGLEIAVAQLDSDQAKSFESFWAMLDEQELPLYFRKRLDQNGLRAAVMASNPPSSFQELVQPRPINVDELGPMELQLHKTGRLEPKTRMVSHSRVSNREGQAHEIAISDIHPAVSWIIRSDERQSPGSGELVRGTMSVTTYPQGDGSVRLVLRPKVHYGQARKRISDSFLMESSQNVKTIDDLKLDITLRAGESVVIAPTQDVAEFGQVLFGIPEPLDPQQKLADADESIQPRHRVLIIRLVQTQMDDLFSDANYEKLTTTPRH